MRWNLSNRVMVLGSCVALVVPVASAVCASTPAAAVSLSETIAGQIMQGEDGYRVTSVRWDPLLRQGWAMVARCGHPEWPEVALPTRVSNLLRREEGTALIEVVDRPLVVRAGDTVRLWRRENDLRIEVAAIAEESGGLGKSIRVRLMHAGVDGQPERQMVGVVRGPEDVEMQR
ncbi:flagellar basal body P-ring formation chaperone FlgA [Edaphobacter aggregans]|uniref:Flagellar basal body P-ring formation chaperone FlgA n=1 Tax=Edaphobacter aggregans TaxID=570835 RepID=A0A428MDA6_9BACT|nr:flagella basal body P-ring formation protein FlgA [Edaphobacter aggregans]RSL14880.1 flagellar basal body P-ring formation chaperone FlgA [Edaphobacter aggregans]